MSNHIDFIQPAEAAFIAGLNDRQLSRVVDEHILPDLLFRRDDGARRYTRFGAALASCYFGMDGVIVADARRGLLAKVTDAVAKLSHMTEVINLQTLPKDIDWKLDVGHFVIVDLYSQIHEVYDRAKDVARAQQLVTVEPDVMGGESVFSGTRVPIDIVLASVDSGVDMARLKASYPFLTDAHIDAARIYQSVNPRRGRPRRLSDLNPSWKVIDRKTIRRKAA